MLNAWTLGRKIGFGFAAMVVIASFIAVIRIYQLLSVVSTRSRYIDLNAQTLIELGRLKATYEEEVADFREAAGREARLVDAMQRMRGELDTSFDVTLTTILDEDGRGMLANALRSWKDERAAQDHLLSKRMPDGGIDMRYFDNEYMPRREATERAFKTIVEARTKILEDAKRQMADANSRAATFLITLASLGAIIAVVCATWLARSITREIGAAITRIQSSSSELEAAANQQATGSRDQATATNQVTSTIRELLATSRQISESAQRVSGIAEDTMSATRLGDQTVQKAQEAIGLIKKQVDFIVSHMLNLGKKSQQIGGILEIINELAEQTNILAINATIESAGAGEAGKRFAVVAEEIRKLADRVGGSTKEIRLLVDEIRTAANSTVMATEDGTKAVDSGARQFAEVAAAFTKIAQMIGTTSEAAREIELSTKHQTTAVEQVNTTIADVAQAAKENEASSRQTLQTSTELALLSRNLSNLIQPRATA